MKKILLTILILVLLIVVVWFFVFSKKDTAEEIEIIIPLEEKVEEIVEEVPVLPQAFEHDKDRDGVEDKKEEELGTSDLEFDTDGDGLSDKTEIEKWKTDPTNHDTDGDGYGDGVEVLSGYNPLGEGTL